MTRIPVNATHMCEYFNNEINMEVDMYSILRCLLEWRVANSDGIANSHESSEYEAVLSTALLRLQINKLAFIANPINYSRYLRICKFRLI